MAQTLRFNPTCQVWPQYFALTLVIDMLAKRPEWRTRRAYFNTNISPIEPFMESLAQLVVKIGIWTFFVQDNLAGHQGAENPLFDDGWEANFFYFTTCVSGLASVMGIVRFFKDGPVRFCPKPAHLEDSSRSSTSSPSSLCSSMLLPRFCFWS